MSLSKIFISSLASCLLLSGCGKNEKAVNLPENKPVITEIKPVTLKVGHVGHDHHLPLFVALEMAEKNPATFCPKGITLKKKVDKKRYELLKNGKKIVNLRIMKVGGGSKMPTALAQNVIDVGFGGVAPVLAAIDQGSPLKIIAPLHSKGDMFVLTPNFPAENWQEFVEFAKKSPKPIRIGYKNPIAVAKIIFENALKHEEISFSSNINNSNVQVHLVNVKGGGKLNSALANKLIDGYAGNNPFPAIGEDKKMLKVICELENLPPRNFKDHPCCCIAAGSSVLKDKSEAIEALLKMNTKAVKLINSDLELAAKIASRWIGTSKAVEMKSIPTSGYSMEDSAEWHKTMEVWAKAMNKLGFFKKKLKDLSEQNMGKEVYDFTLLKKKK
jgi:sulfonate transport system substrate-binding protein